MEQEIAFETSAFGGFNKKSVLKYIDELGEQNRSVVEGLERQLAEAQAKNQELAGAVEALNAKVKQVEQESAQKAEGLEQTVAELREDLAQQRNTLREREAELAREHEEHRQLAMRAENLERKGRKYDEAMLQIGSALMEARESADDIIKEAQQKAGQISADTVESIRQLGSEVSTFKSDVATLRVTLQFSMSELERRLDAIDSSIDTLDAAVRGVEFRGEPVVQPDISSEEETAPAQEEQPQQEDEAGEMPKKEREQGAKPANFFW